jgi:hypothetical protein
MLTLRLHLVLLLDVSRLLGECWVMEHGIAHELLLDQFHPAHDRGGISLLHDVDVVTREIYLLLSALLPVLSLRRIWLLLGTLLAADVVFVHDADSSIWLTTQKHRVLLPFDPLDDLLGFSSHFIRVLDLGLEALDNGQYVIRLAHRHVKLVIRGLPTPQLMFLCGKRYE